MSSSRPYLAVRPCELPVDVGVIRDFVQMGTEREEGRELV
jgi:hypothetical protein